MFRNIISSIFTKGFSAISNFIIVVLTAQFLGAGGRGEIALLILAISITALFHNLASGTALSYYSKKYSQFSLFVLSFFWLLIVSILIPSVLSGLDLFSSIYFAEVCILSVFTGGISIFQSILLAEEKIKALNIIEFIKTIISLVLLVLHFYFFKVISISAVLHSLLLGTIAANIVGFLHTRKYIKITRISNIKLLIQDVFKMGFELQINNILQMVNYRFCFYIIEKFISLEVLGIVSVAVSLAETIWIICKSISTVLFSRLINEENSTKKIQLTLNFTKLSYILTFLATLILVLLPRQLFTFVFGDAFEPIPEILLSYSPSIVFLAFFTMLNHYFSATNQNWINIFSSFIGSVIVVVFGFIFIPTNGLLGSGIVISIAYFCMLLFLLFQFKRQSKVKISEFFSNFTGLFKMLRNA